VALDPATAPPRRFATFHGLTPFLGLAALVFLAFGGALQNGFVRFDDHGYVVENPMVRGGLTWPGVRWAFTTGDQANWHPLTWLSHMADMDLYGLNPAGHHFTSLLLHAANAILLFLVLRGLTGRFWPALLAAAVWAVHPLRTESVVWISERKDVLSTFFGLLALGAYGRASSRGRMGWPPFFFALSLMAKPAWVTLPFLLLLLDVWPLKRWPGMSLRPLAAEKVPLFLLSAISCAVTLWAQDTGGAVQTFEGYPLEVRLANAAVAYGHYLRALVWPAGLSFFHPHPGAGIPLWQVGGTSAVLVLATGLAVWARRRQPWVLVGWLWFLGALVPMIGLVQVGGAAWAERYSYLPHIGLIAAVVWGAAEIWDRQVGMPRRGVRLNRPGLSRWRPCFTSIPVVLVATLAWLSQQQTQVWRDSETLFRHALAVDADNAVAHFNLGTHLMRAGRRDEAAAHYGATLELQPEHWEARNNLAWLWATDPRATPAQTAQALALAEQALAAVRGPSASLLDTLAAARAATGDFAGAVATAEQAEMWSRTSGSASLSEKIEARLRLYRAGQPYRE